jgi:hypothetical protein
MTMDSNVPFHSIFSPYKIQNYIFGQRRNISITNPKDFINFIQNVVEINFQLQ